MAEEEVIKDVVIVEAVNEGDDGLDVKREKELVSLQLWYGLQLS